MIWVTTFLSQVVFLSTQFFRLSLEEQLYQKAQKNFRSDITISQRFLFSQLLIQELARETNATNWAEEIEFFSMIKVIKVKQNVEQLVLVKAVSSNYPIRGIIKNHNQEVVSFKKDKDKNKENKPFIDIDSYLSDLLGVHPGDTLQLGNKTFFVRNLLPSDTSATFRLGQLAPLVYISIEDLPDTELVSQFSTFNHNLQLTFSHFHQMEQAKKHLLNRFKKNPEISILDSQEYGEQWLRPARWVLDFFSLFAFIGFIGSFFFLLYRHQLFIQDNLAQYFILNIFGKPLSRLAQEEVFRFGLRETLMLAVSLLSSGILVGFIQSQVFNHFVFPRWQSIIFFVSLIFFIIWLTLFFESYQIIRNLNLNQALNAFQSSILYRPALGIRYHIVRWCSYVILVSLLGASLFPAKYLWVSLLATIGGHTLLVVGCSWILAHIISKWGYQLPWSFSLPLLRIARSLSSLLVKWSVLSFMVLQVLMVFHLRTIFHREIVGDPNNAKPTVFLFDIPEEDKDSLLEWLEKRGVQALVPSPFIRARIIRHNGRPWEREMNGVDVTREQQTIQQIRSRGLNLTIRDQLTSSETATAQLPLNNFGSRLPISLEKRFAERMGLKLGDQLTIDIQNIEFDTIVYQLRTVRWNSFLPNFFAQVPSGFIDEVPKVWLAAAHIPKDQLTTIIKELRQKFPGVSLVNLEQIRMEFDQLLELLQFSFLLISAANLIAFLTVIVFVFVLTFSFRHSEWHLLNILGISRQMINRLQINEVLFFLALAILTATTFSWLLREIVQHLIHS